MNVMAGCFSIDVSYSLVPCAASNTRKQNGAVGPVFRYHVCSGLEHATSSLVAFDAAEKGSKIALTKGQVILALNQLKEDWADSVMREDLEQVAFFVTVDEDVVLLDSGVVFSDVWNAVVDGVVVLVVDVEEVHACAFHLVERIEQAFRRESDVLNARPFVLTKVFFDLRRKACSIRSTRWKAQA